MLNSEYEIYKKFGEKIKNINNKFEYFRIWIDYDNDLRICLKSEFSGYIKNVKCMLLELQQIYDIFESTGIKIKK